MNILYKNNKGEIVWTEDFYTIKKSSNQAHYDEYQEAVKLYGYSMRSFYVLDSILNQYEKIDTVEKLKAIEI